MSASLALEHVTDTLTNLAHLEDLRMASAVNEANHLILGVEAKVDAGVELSPVEYSVLWAAIAEETIEVLQKHPELLG
jgi:hypothetical protein